MAISSLRNIVDGSFVRKFQGLASGNSVTTGGASSKISIQTGLRVGAQTYAKAVQGLNGIISYLNLGKSTLEGLLDITDKMVTLTKTAMKIGTSSDKRNNLNEQFFKLARDYEKIVSNAKFGDRDLLTTEGISGIFQVLGLDKEASDSIASVFKEFMVPDKDDNLASETVKGSRPYTAPFSAYATAASGENYIVSKLTDSNITSGFITQQGGIFIDNDDILNQNPGYQAIFNVNNDGSVSTMEAGTLGANVSLRGASRENGNTVFESTDDFLGFNPGGYNQLYIADTQGNVIHQVTNNAGSTTYSNISSGVDSKTVLIESVTGGVRSLSLYQAANLGDDPALGTVTVVDTLAPTEDFNNLVLSYDRTHVAYTRDTTATGGSVQTILKDVATLTTDPWLAAQPGAQRIGSIDNNQLILQFPNGGNSDLMLYTLGSGVYTPFITNQRIDQMTTVPISGPGTDAYIATLNNTTKTVNIYGASTGSTPVATYSFAAGDTVNLANLIHDSSGRPRLSLAANLPSLTGDSDRELYVLGVNPQSSSSKRLARSSAEYEEIFDKTFDLKTRPNAYRMLHDLEALQGQLKKNVKALDNAMEVVGKNVELVRAAGFAFLDLSQQVSDTRDADKIAEDLRDRIRKNARSAMSQAENLEAITVAALAFDSSKLTSAD